MIIFFFSQSISTIVRSWCLWPHAFSRASIKFSIDVHISMLLLVVVHAAVELLALVERIGLHLARNGVDVREVVADKQPAAVRLIIKRKHIDAAPRMLRLEDEAEGVLVADLGRLVADEGPDEAARVDGELGEAARARAAPDADEVREMDLVDQARRLRVQAPHQVRVQSADRVLEHAEHKVAFVRLVAVVDEIRSAHQQAHRRAAVGWGIGEVVAADAVDAAQREGKALDHVVAVDGGQRADGCDEWLLL